MIQIISGANGRGKTRVLLEQVNAGIHDAKGSLIYLDKNNKHMYELDRKVRLINVKEYCIEDPKEFIGFICGLISQDHDLEKIYLDSFLSVASASEADLVSVMDKLERISSKFSVDFVISISLSEMDLPEKIRTKVIVSL